MGAARRNGRRLGFEAGGADWTMGARPATALRLPGQSEDKLDRRNTRAIRDELAWALACGEVRVGPEGAPLCLSLSQEETAAVLGLSQQRVSQIVREAGPLRRTVKEVSANAC